MVRTGGYQAFQNIRDIPSALSIPCFGAQLCPLVSRPVAGSGLDCGTTIMETKYKTPALGTGAFSADPRGENWEVGALAEVGHFLHLPGHGTDFLLGPS